MACRNSTEVTQASRAALRDAVLSFRKDSAAAARSSAVSAAKAATFAAYAATVASNCEADEVSDDHASELWSRASTASTAALAALTEAFGRTILEGDRVVIKL